MSFGMTEKKAKIWRKSHSLIKTLQKMLKPDLTLEIIHWKDRFQKEKTKKDRLLI